VLFWFNTINKQLETDNFGKSVKLMMDLHNHAVVIIILVYLDLFVKPFFACEMNGCIRSLRRDMQRKKLSRAHEIASRGNEMLSRVHSTR